MFNKQLGIKFIVYLHKRGNNDPPSPVQIRYCHGKYPCFLDITSENKKQSHEICCSNHLDKILDEFSTDKYRLYIKVSSKTTSHNLNVLLKYRWRCILFDCKNACPETLINVLSSGVNAQKIIWDRAYIDEDFFTILFTLLYKNMTDTIYLSDLRTGVLNYLQKLGLDIIIPANDFGSIYELYIYRNYIKITRNHTIYHQEEYDYEHLLL